MSKSTHQIAVKAVDQTSGAFNSIQSRAANASAKLQSMLGGALAAAGAYLGFRQISSAINELGKLSDVAQRTSTSVDDLTKTTTALSVLGVNTSVESLAKQFEYMQKSTGRTGMQGFYDVIAEIGKIEDTALRSKEAIRVFGRSGMELMPIINGANDSVIALQNVIDVMPAIADNAAGAGDAISDAMTIAGANMKSIWLNALGTVANWFDGQFKGGIRAAAASSADYLAYYAKVGATKALEYWEKITTFFEAVGTGFGALFSGEGSFMERVNRALEAYDAEMAQREEHLGIVAEDNAKKIIAWEEAKAAKVEKIQSSFRSSYNKAAMSTGSRLVASAEKAAGAIRSAQIRNDLMMAGSNAAAKLQLLGPSYQTEAKKTNSLLEKIAKNTEKTAANTEATDIDLGVINGD